MKTSIKLSAIALSIFTLLTTAVKAQNTATGSTASSTSTTYDSGIRLSVGADAAIPLGSLKNNYNWAIGGSVQADFPIVQKQLFVTVNAGYLNFFNKNNNTLNTGSDLELLPVKAGLKYFPITGLYIQGEAGATFLTNKSEVGATKSAAFVYAPQVGYLIPLGGKNYLDAGVRFEGNTKFTDNGTTNNFLALRVAYAFGI